MGDDSFDPRSWGKPADAAPAPDAAAPPSPAAPPPQDGIDKLPEAWREAAKTLTPRPLPAAPGAGEGRAPKTPKTATTRRAPSRRLIASVVLVLVAALAARVTRAPPVSGGAPAAATATAGVAPAPAASPTAIRRRLVLASAGDIAGALTANGVDPGVAGKVSAETGRLLTGAGEVRAMIELQRDGGAMNFTRLQASLPDGSGAVVTRDAEGAISGTHVAAELKRQVKVLRGELDSDSFYSSAVAAGLQDTLIPEFINAFSFDFNLASEVSPGDTFEVAYEQQVDATGNPVGHPQLLYGSLTTKAKSLALYRFQPAGGEIGWYDGNGGSTKRGLMRTPVDGARITSKFGMRFHPVLHYTRLHAGVDFAVPIGTPVYAAAAGVVIGSHPTVCGGNMAVVQHDNGWVTRYFHLSHFAPGLHEGQRVPQGYTLGLSGVTGTCTTGPHLHFEVRINGEPVDPLGVKMGDDKRQTLDGAAMAAFIAQRNRVDVARAQQMQ